MKDGARILKKGASFWGEWTAGLGLWAWAALVLGVAAFAMRLTALLSSHYAFGADGYYYAAQVRSYWEHGRFFSPDSSLPLYFLTYFSRLGSDIVFTNKIAVSLLGALVAWPGFLVGRRLAGVEAGGVLAAAILTSCTFATYFTIEFVKNLGGIFFFLFFLNQLLVVLEQAAARQIRPRSVAGLVASFALVFFSHKLMAGLALVFLGPALLWGLRRTPRLLIGLLVTAGVFAAGAAFLFPNLLHGSDFSRLEGILAPGSPPPLWSYVRQEAAPPWVAGELLLLTLSPLVLLWSRRTLSPPALLIALLCAALILAVNAPFWVYRTDNLVFRLLLVTFVPAALLVAPLARWAPAPAVLVLCALLVPAQFLGLRRAQQTSPFDYELYDGLLPLIELPENHLLIVHQGFDYFYCYRGRGDAFHFLPEKKHDRRPVFRLVHGVPLEWLDRQPDVRARVRVLPGYYLMPEDTYRRFSNGLSESERRKLLTWRNPHTHRPGYMLRNEARFKKDKRPRQGKSL